MKPIGLFLVLRFSEGSLGHPPQVMQKMMELIDLELQGNVAAKTYAYYMAFQLMRGVDEELALRYAEEAFRTVVLAEGRDSWVSRMLEEVLAEAKKRRTRRPDLRAGKASESKQ